MESFLFSPVMFLVCLLAAVRRVARRDDSGVFAV
jgi:hypothetical protein